MFAITETGPRWRRLANAPACATRCYAGGGKEPEIAGSSPALGLHITIG